MNKSKDELLCRVLLHPECCPYCNSLSQKGKLFFDDDSVYKIRESRSCKCGKVWNIFYKVCGAELE